MTTTLIGSEARTVQQVPGYRLGFALFVLVNAALFVRPADVLPSLANAPVYNVLILLCIAASLPAILHQLTPSALARQPITLCVVLMLPAVVMSHLSHFFFFGVASSTPIFAKVLCYYLLAVGLVNTPQRLRQMIFWLGIFTFAVTGLALLDHYRCIDLPERAMDRALAAEKLLAMAEPPEEIPVVRLSAFGIFNNPNDLSRIIVIGVMVCLYWMTDRSIGIWRWLWIPPLILFGHAMHLTQSRGGFLAMLGALGCFFYFRFGRWKTLGIGAIAMPLLFVVFAGRQTDLRFTEDTGLQRIQIWYEGFLLMIQAPIFGIGMDRYGDYVGYVAHNSYLHCFVELGFLGGLCFLGAWYLSLRGLYLVGDRMPMIRQPELVRMRPYLAGILAGYAVGMLSSTRSYLGPTYLLLGMAVVYLNMVADRTGGPVQRFTARMLQTLVLISLLMLIFTYLYVKFGVRWDVED